MSVSAWFRLVKFEHTIFALPFAYLAMCLSVRGIPAWPVWGWITLAMAGGRTAGMALNRVIDRHIDARNPRTAGREIPSGVISAAAACVLAGVSFAAMVWAAWRLNPVCAWLAPFVVGALVLYPYLKRWTWLAHSGLGLVYAAIPLGVWLALVGHIEAPAVLLSLAMAAWVIVRKHRLFFRKKPERPASIK